MTTEKLSKLSKEQLIDIIVALNDTANLKVRAKIAFAKQVDSMVTLLDSTNLATASSLSDKDEKTWERGRTIMDKLPSYISELEALENRIIPAAADSKRLTEKASTRSIEAMRDEDD